MQSSKEILPISNIKSEMKVIEKLKAEIDNMFSETNSSDFVYSLTKLQNLIKYCMHEVEDIEVVNVLFEKLREEKDGYKLQTKRLTEENAWLRDELKATQGKLQKKELDCIEVEESKKTLEFLLELQSNQNIENNLSKNQKASDSTNLNDNKTINQMSESVTNSTISFNNFGSVIEQPSINGNLSRNNLAMPNAMPVHEVPPRLKTLHQLVIQYASQERYEIAIPLCRQTISDLEKCSGRDHPDVATMLNILALVYRDKGDLDEAVRSLTDALEIRKKVLGPDSPKVAATLNNLSVLYGKQGNHAEAEPLCRDALKIRERILGTQHPDVAKQLNNLALLCQSQGKYDEVDRYYTRALRIYTSVYPSNDPNIIKTNNNLATSYFKQGRLQDAENILKEVLSSAWDRHWVGREKDIKSQPIWVIAEERERMKTLSMSTDTLSHNLNTDQKLSPLFESNGREPNGDTTDPPYGFEIKHNNKEEKRALLSSLKLLASLYAKDNKLTASNIIEEWLIWASRSFSNYTKDIRMLSYDSSLLQCDLYDSSPSIKTQTLWYPSPSLVGRPQSKTSNLKYSSNTPFLYLNSSRDRLINSNSSNTLHLSEYPGQKKSMNKPKLPVHLSPYLYKTSSIILDQKSKYESEKGNVYDNSDKY